MLLQVCEGCMRHIAANESHCPFCAAPSSPREPSPLRAGRFARAVMFAGTAIAGCDQGKGATQDHPVTTTPTATPSARGTITDVHGVPIVGATVTLFGATTYSALSDHHGRYRFDDIPAGNYKMTVGADQNGADGFSAGYTEQSLNVRGDEHVDVTLTLQYQQPAMPYGAPPRRHRVV